MTTPAHGPGRWRRLSPVRRRLWLGIGAVVTALVLVVVVRSVADRFSAVEPGVDQAVRGPVILVPGYGGSGGSLGDLDDALPDSTILEPPGDGTGDLREQAAALGDAVDDVMRRTGAGSVDIVAYSAGGVVARYYVAELGGADRVRRVATIASPHHGTDLASFGTDAVGGACPEACRQLDPDSDLLRDLNRGDETPDGPRWLSVWTETDGTVSPPDSAVLEGATSTSVQALCGPELALSHGDITHDPAVLSLVEAFLADPGGDEFNFGVSC